MFLIDLNLLCTEKVRDEFSGVAYEPIDGVAMISSLRLVTGDIFLGIIQRKVATSTDEAKL